MAKESNFAIIQNCQRSSSVSIGVMIECAMDNAGFDGFNYEYMEDDQLQEVVYHLMSIVDGKMLDATDEEYEVVSAWLGMN